MYDIGFEPRLEPPPRVVWDEPDYDWNHPFAVYDPDPEVDE